MKSLDQWLAEYGESHQNETNKLVHWICVPTIFFSVTGLLFCIKLPFSLGGQQVNLACIVMLMITVYYALLSKTIWVGMLVFGIACLGICHLIETWAAWPLWAVCAGLFVLAWIGQFYGHSVEGKKPSFLKDIQFLLIGPAWLMSFIYRRIGIKP